jgi:DNA polymerase-1
MGFDWRQAEVRILAALSGDKNLKAAVASGDYHRATYAGMAGIPMADVTPEMRERSKVITYSILYSGGDPYHVAEELGITDGEALAEIRKYFQLYPQLHSYLGGVRNTAVSTRHVRSHMNRLRRLEGKDLRKIQNQACNSVGQQSCGTMLKIALLKMHQMGLLDHPAMKGFGQVIPVFDAIYWVVDASVPLEKHIEVVRQAVELMVGDVKLEADFYESPDSWGEVKPVPVSPQVTEATIGE